MYKKEDDEDEPGFIIFSPFLIFHLETVEPHFVAQDIKLYNSAVTAN